MESLVGGEFLIVNNFVDFVGSHMFDIVLFGIVAVRVVAGSKASLRVILVACLMLACVFYIGGIVNTQLVKTSTVLNVAVFIGIRLIALKIIFMAIDWE